MEQYTATDVHSRSELENRDENPTIPSAKRNITIPVTLSDPSSPSINFYTVCKISQKIRFPPCIAEVLQVFGSMSLSDLTASLTSVPAHTQHILEAEYCCLSSLNHRQRTTTHKDKS